MSRIQIHGLLRQKLFRRLVVVRVLGQMQDGIIQSALAGFVLFSPESQDSTVAVVGAFAILLLPYSVIGPFMGVLLDRWRRRQVLLWSNLIRALFVLLLALVTWLESSVVLTGLIVLVVLGLNRLILTALAASIPRTVPASLLVSANSFAPVAGTTAAAIGGGITIGVSAAMGLDRISTLMFLLIGAGGLILTAAASLRLPINSLGPHEHEERETLHAAFLQLRRGFVFLRHQQSSWRSMWAVMSHRLAYGVAILVAIAASKSILSPDSNAEALSVVALAVGAAGFGAFIGAVVTPPMVRWTSTRTWSTTIAAISTVGVPLAMSHLTMVGFVVTGFILGISGQSLKISTDTVIAYDIPDDTRGRVFSLFDVGVNVALLAGIALGALLVTLTEFSILLPIAAAIFLAISTAFFSQSRTPKSMLP